MKTLAEAIVDLDPKDDAQWTQSGDPMLSHLVDVTGEKVSRDDVDKLTGGLKRSDTWVDDLAETVDLQKDAAAPDDPPLEPTAPEPAPRNDAGSSPDKHGIPPNPVAARKSAIDRARYVVDDKAKGVTAGQVVNLIDVNGITQAATVLEHFGNGEVDLETADGTKITGVQHVSVIMQTPADDPIRHLARWDVGA